MTSVQFSVVELSRRQTMQGQGSHLEGNQNRNLGGFYIVILIVAVACVLLRLISRTITHLGLARDDWTFVGGSIIAIGSFIVSLIYAWDAGLGEHWEALTQPQKILFHKLNYAFNILNVSCYPIIKLSILLFYLRIFISQRFRQLCWAGIVFVSCMCIANTLVAIFACRPIAGFYDLTIQAKCIDDVQFYWGTAILNVLTDLYILVLPMPMVWRLHATFQKKLAISAVFMLGGLTFIVSIIRIVYYLQYTNEDPSYSFLGTAYATPAEVCLGIMVASAPTWRSVWSYTAYMTHSIWSKVTGSRESFKLSTIHEEARSVAKAGGTNAGSESRIELEEVSSKSSAIKVGREESVTGGELRNTVSFPPSTAPSGSQSRLSLEPVQMV